MKRKRAPYASRYVVPVIVILSIIVVAACVAAGLEIKHLHNQVNALQGQVATIYQLLLQTAQRIK
jgi:hypothetical protein